MKTETAYIPDPDADPSSPNYSQPIKQVDNIWHYDLVSGGTLFAYNPKSVETKWELGDHDPVSVVTAYNWFDNQNTSIFEPDAQPTNLYARINVGNLTQSVIDYSGGLKKTTQNSYNDWIDETHWMLGRLDESVVIHSNSSSNMVRSSSFDYDPVTGLLSQEVIEPNNAQYELITDYYYDDFGNIVNKIITPAGFAPRTILENDYDLKGQFVIKSRNALDHETVIENDSALGLPISSVDPNGLLTIWDYDQTGRQIYQKLPDGIVTTNSYIWDFSTVVNVPDSTGTVIVQKSAYKLHTEISGSAPVTTWFDKQGNEIRKQTRSANGRFVNVDKGYNSISLLVAISEPYFVGDMPNYTFTEYDELGRIKYVTTPDGTVTETEYNGLSLSVIKDRNGKAQNNFIKKCERRTFKCY